MHHFREPGKWLNDARGWKMHDWQMKEAFGLRAADKWPQVGISGRYIGNVVVQVQPAGGQMSGYKHRTMARCPMCGRWFTAGKIHMHFRHCPDNEK